MSMLDRLRESAMDDDEFLFDQDEDLYELTTTAESVSEERRILGMNAAERMVVSIFLFFATSIVGTLLLIALQRIDIGL